jgi:hypothetical protein
MSDVPEPPEPTLPVETAVAADQAAAHATEGHGHHGPFHTHCENCGTQLAGPYCHKCGQHDFEFHRSFWHVFLEALENLFHFEGKFFRNIVTLLFQPGRLTADFNAGKRAAQMPPFRLYIFVSFIFFLLIFIGGKESDLIKETSRPHQGVTIQGKPVELRELWRDTAAQMKPEDWQDPAKVNQAVEQIVAKAAGSPAPDKLPAAEPTVADELRAAGEEAKAEIAQAQAESKAGAKPPALSEEKVGFLRYLEQQGRRMNDPAHRQRLAASIKSHLPHMLMFCLPLFALYTRGLFRKSRQVYLQHLVVAVHFHTFIYLWVLFSRGWTALAALPGWGLDAWVDFACTVWLWLYPLLMLRRLFANSWKKTFVKTVLLTGIYALTLGLGFVAMAALIFLSA